MYTRSAMGMPVSENAMKELMCRVLGNLLQDGFVAKYADDLHSGGNSSEQLLHNWTKSPVCLSVKQSTSASKTFDVFQVNDHLRMNLVTRLTRCKLPSQLCSHAPGMKSLISA